MGKDRKVIKVEIKVPCKGPELRSAIDGIADSLCAHADDWSTLSVDKGTEFLNEKLHRLFAEELEKLTYGDMKMLVWPLTARRYLAMAKVMLSIADKPGFDWLWVIYTAAKLDDEYADKFEVDVREGRITVLKKFAKLFEPFLGSDLDHVSVRIADRLFIRRRKGGQ